MSTPFSVFQHGHSRLFARLVWPEGGRRTQLDQSLMVVVFVLKVCAPPSAHEPKALVKVDGWAQNMAHIVAALVQI